MSKATKCKLRAFLRGFKELSKFWPGNQGKCRLLLGWHCPWRVALTSSSERLIHRSNALGIEGRTLARL